MTFQETFPYPPEIVNLYTWEEIKKYLTTQEINSYGTYIPFFPSAVSTPSEWNSDQTFVKYDRLIRYRPTGFYPIKREQVVYSVRGLYANTVEWSNAIVQILDRGDAAGQDINKFASGSIVDPKVFFHSVRAYQTQYTDESWVDPTTRGLYVTQIIVEYDYHIHANNQYN